MCCQLLDLVERSKLVFDKCWNIEWFDGEWECESVMNGTNDFDIASHDGTNGLKLGGVLVTSTAAELNYLDITTLGESEANKVVTAGNDGVDGFVK